MIRIQPMRRSPPLVEFAGNLCLAVCALAMSGCETSPMPAGDAAFVPVELKLHPVFTRPADWTGDGRLDGVEVLAELRDQFGDPSKGVGTFVFEIYSYRTDSPDPRGDRLVNPWIGAVDTVVSQRERWSRTSRGYSFLLTWPKVSLQGTYVLTASFSSGNERRLFDQIVIGPQPAGR